MDCSTPGLPVTHHLGEPAQVDTTSPVLQWLSRFFKGGIGELGSVIGFNFATSQQYQLAAFSTILDKNTEQTRKRSKSPEYSKGHISEAYS